jgi:hypothetical protein
MNDGSYPESTGTLKRKSSDSKSTGTRRKRRKRMKMRRKKNKRRRNKSLNRYKWKRRRKIQMTWMQRWQSREERKRRIFFKSSSSISVWRILTLKKQQPTSNPVPQFIGKTLGRLTDILSRTSRS